MPVKPILGDLELELVQEIEASEQQVRAQHAVPALEGDFLQALGRRAAQVTLSGILAGDEAAEGLKQLREKFRTAQPVPFVADIATATKVDQVLIEEMGVRELAGKPRRFEYAFTLREFIPAPPVEEEEPPEPPEPPPPPNPQVGQLIVEVVVEGQPDFDFSTVTVTVTGRQDDGTDLSRTLTNRTDNVWTETEFPPGTYTARAVVNEPPMSGTAEAVVQGGQQTKVTIILRTEEPGRTADRFIVHYWFDKAFIEPCLREVMRDVAKFASQHADHKLLIVGHTDLVGSDEYNQALSERRARSAFAYLTFGLDQTAAVDEWDRLRRTRVSGPAGLVNDNWGTREYQYILQDLGFYQRDITEVHDGATDQAVRDFQASQGLAVDGIVGDNTWRVLIQAYLAQDNLKVLLDAFLPNAKDGCDGGPLKWLGCGEKDPVLNTQNAWRPNRRTEFLFVKADRLPCDVPKPVTFDLPAPGAVGSAWCLGSSPAGDRCCFAVPAVEKACPEGDQRFCRRPAVEQTVRVKGSIRFEDDTPLANAEIVLISPEGEFLRQDTNDPGEVERPSGAQRGRPVPGRTDENGRFEIPRDTPAGVYVLEVRGGFVARLEGQEPEAAKGPLVCKKIEGSEEFTVIVFRAGSGDPSRELRIIVFDEFGEVRKNTAVTILFDGGVQATANTNDRGEVVFPLDESKKTGRIRYNVTDTEPPKVILFSEFFIELTDIQTEEGIRRRLHNLGYMDEDLSRAVLSFQATHGIDATGVMDDETRSKLAAVHDGLEPPVPEFELSEEQLGPEEIFGDGPPV